MKRSGTCALSPADVELKPAAPQKGVKNTAHILDPRELVKNQSEEQLRLAAEFALTPEWHVAIGYLRQMLQLFGPGAKLPASDQVTWLETRDCETRAESGRMLRCCRASRLGRLASDAERRSRLSMLAISWCCACKSEAPVAEKDSRLMPSAA